MNQDRILLYLDPLSHSILFAVFDGHGKDGHLIASLIRDAFFNAFYETELASTDTIESRMVEALRSAERDLKARANIDSKRGGCTANIGYLCHNSKGDVLVYSVCVGDSE